ncbi:hypothetical protein Dimus_016878 [Dionaea muscipula]
MFSNPLLPSLPHGQFFNFGLFILQEIPAQHGDWCKRCPFLTDFCLNFANLTNHLTNILKGKTPISHAENAQELGEQKHGNGTHKHKSQNKGRGNRTEDLRGKPNAGKKPQERTIHYVNNYVNNKRSTRFGTLSKCTLF